MLDGKAFKAHFPDDPEPALALPVERPSLRNCAVLLEALAALEDEFRTILKQNASSAD